MGSKKGNIPDSFSLVNAADHQVVFRHAVSQDFGAYGPFQHSLRLDFSAFPKQGRYYLEAGRTASPVFTVSDSAYKGAADFCLQYMRQQRSGFNPYLRDSCHTHDGFTVYGPMPDGTHVNVWGGWHDAGDYLQYITTSATADYYLLAAYRDFPEVFTDSCRANELPGKNGVADVLDEGKWGLDWLLKMNPRPDWFFNQIADDRDHAGFRLPNLDSVNYGHGLKKPGFTQTACDVSPYYYTERDWQDDMELGAAMLWQLTGKKQYLQQAMADADADPLKLGMALYMAAFMTG